MRLTAWALALFLSVMLVLMPAPALAASTSAAPQGCVIDVLGIRVCGTLLGVPLPEVIKVTVTPAPIRVPGPTETVTVRPPQPTKTVTVPGPTVFEDGPAQPNETVTVTQEPQARPTSEATVTETTTVTAEPTRQPVVEDGTLGDTKQKPGFFSKDIDLGDDKVTASEAGLGLLATLALVGLMLLALYGGYILGYKDAERKDTNFMRALSETIAIRGKHR